MPDIPAGAKTPSDHQSAQIKPEEVPDGYELLRPPIALEFWEVTDFMALVSSIRTNGSTVEMTSKNIAVIGRIAKILQEEFALDSQVFRAWLKQGTFEDAAVRLTPVLYAYAAALGEAGSSGS